MCSLDPWSQLRQGPLMGGLNVKPIPPSIHYLYLHILEGPLKFYT